MVTVEKRVADIALKYGVMPLGTLGQAVAPVADAVRFDVRLGADVNAVLVAEVVHPVIVRIMAHSQTVDVILTEKLDILYHLLVCRLTPVRRARLVAVDALELNRPSVDEKNPVFDLVAADANFDPAFVAAAFHRERVEIRVFIAPKTRSRKRKRERSIPLRDEIARFHALGVVKRRGNLSGVAVRIDFKAGRPVAIGGVGGRIENEIADASLGKRHQRHIAEDAGEAEHVLVFHVASVAPAVDPDGKRILTGDKRVGDIELARQLRIFAVADVLAVHPDPMTGIDTVETEHRAAVFPGIRQGEPLDVGRYRVVFGTDARRILLVGIALIRVMRNAPPAHLNAARDINIEPSGIVEPDRHEILRLLIDAAAPPVTPCAVERHRPISTFRHRVGSGRQTILFIDCSILPDGSSRRRERGSGKHREKHRLHHCASKAPTVEIVQLRHRHFIHL